ncbi:DUF6366 family protein [Brassicibacter mesophilus]|uniref:DUF6366 family protein n=1 Tax=Brassicibacter mesophilus TaxID=745119 RepID=UPI003D1FE5E3
MNIRDKQDKQEKRKMEEYKKHPMINFSDSINHSTMGNLNELTKGGCLTKIIIIVIIIGILFFLSRYYS